MAGSWTASVDDLKRLTAFLEGLTALSNRTGVTACVYSGTEIDMGGNVLRVNSRRDEEGFIAYFVDEYEN